MEKRTELTTPEEDRQYVDPVIEEYKKHIDHAMLRENLKLTMEQRILKMEAAQRDLEILRNAMKRATGRK